MNVHVFLKQFQIIYYFEFSKLQFIMDTKKFFQFLMGFKEFRLLRLALINKQL